MGQEDFSPLIQTVRAFWATRILILIIFIFWIFVDPKFPDFQVPDFQISRNLAWAHPLGPNLGPAWIRLGPSLGPAWARLGPGLGPAWARLGPSWGAPVQTPPPAPDELSDPNLNPLPTHPGIKYVARALAATKDYLLRDCLEFLASPPILATTLKHFSV